MPDIKLTKSSLRSERVRLTQLERYLPTLQLKKAMLQLEVNEVQNEIAGLESSLDERRLHVSTSAMLLGEKIGINMEGAAEIKEIKKNYENVAGVDIPIYEGVQFAPFEYSLLDTPAWLDAYVLDLRKLAESKAKVKIAEEKKRVLEHELRQVTIRVNLFEKNLIPKAMQNIKKIKVFLGDQELAAVSQAKVAKTKIEMKKKAKDEN
jgi:V/A-type H+-transporting ATPase subunit D